MTWTKLGRVFCPNDVAPWMRSHAANPVADHIENSLYRIYFSTRDQDNRSSIGWVEIDLREPRTVLRISREPVLSPGVIGSFDDSGCSMGSIVREGQRRLLYYMGWNLGVTVPWRNSIGLAVSEDGGETYERISIAPIMDRSDEDPFTLSYPWVIADSGKFRMWYGSNLQWGHNKADMDHMIKYAESLDGRSWERDGAVVIQPKDASEYAFARPCVVKLNSGYAMWYAYRGASYRVGYADSGDGRSWRRQDTIAGIDVSIEGWDSESIEYPSVFRHADKMYLLYCGNGYGKSGFGLAEYNLYPGC